MTSQPNGLGEHSLEKNSWAQSAIQFHWIANCSLRRIWRTVSVDEFRAGENLEHFDMFHEEWT